MGDQDSQRTSVPSWLLQVAVTTKSLFRLDSKPITALSSLITVVGAILAMVVLITPWDFVDAKIPGFIACLGLLVIFLVIVPYEIWKRDTSDLHSQLDKLENLRRHQENQIGHEEKYLQLVVENVDLFAPDWGSQDTFKLRFQIDSGLVYDFQPHQVFVLVTVAGDGMQEPWELRPVPNLLAGKRTQLDTKALPIKGRSFAQTIDAVRKAGKASVSVRLQIILREQEELITLPSEPRSFVIG